MPQVQRAKKDCAGEDGADSPRMGDSRQAAFKALGDGKTVPVKREKGKNPYIPPKQISVLLKPARKAGGRAMPTVRRRYRGIR